MNGRDAGDFGVWLDAYRAAVARRAEVDVPCGSCEACCRSGQMIPVAADDAGALAHIAAEDLVPMPGHPDTFVLTHDAAGRCSQLTEAGCSIYAHRPRACRTYDCRIFPAAGVRPDKPLIAEAALSWQFSHDSAESRRRHSDVRTAAVVLGFPGGLTAPVSPTQLALDAIDGADEL